MGINNNTTPDFFSKENTFENHLLSRIGANKLCIITCDNKFIIQNLTVETTIKFNIKIYDNLSSFLSLSILKGIESVISNNANASFVERIDEIYYNIDVSCFNGLATLIFEESQDEKIISSLSVLCSSNINKYLMTNCILLNKIEKENLSPTIKETAKNAKYDTSKLLAFATELNQLYRNTNTDSYIFTTGIITKYFEKVIDLVRENTPNCDISLSYDQNIICDFLEHQFAVLILNVISNVFRHCSVDTKIEINIREKNEHIHIYIKDYGTGISDEDLADIFKIRFIDSYKELNKINLGLPVVKRIINNHYGIVLLDTSKEGTTVYLTFPKILSDSRHTFLENYSYIEFTSDIKNIASSISGYENFENNHFK